jgi:hypothetical protein
MMRPLVSILSLVLLVGVSSQAGTPEAPLKLKSSPGVAVINAGTWKTIRNGIEHRKVTLEREAPANELGLTLYRFDTSLIEPRVIYAAQHNLKSTDVKSLAVKPALWRRSMPVILIRKDNRWRS